VNSAASAFPDEADTGVADVNLQNEKRPLFNSLLIHTEGVHPSERFNSSIRSVFRTLPIRYSNEPVLTLVRIKPNPPRTAVYSFWSQWERISLNLVSVSSVPLANIQIPKVTMVFLCLQPEQSRISYREAFGGP
jgi:hypothetical protein